MSDSKNLWGGRFKGKADPGFAAFNNSFRFDRRLFEADVDGSIAYCRALVGAGVLMAEEAAPITTGLDEILATGRRDASYFANSAAEDVHSFVDAHLLKLTGGRCRRLRTAP